LINHILWYLFAAGFRDRNLRYYVTILQTILELLTYQLLVYVKPTNGKWWPENAVCDGGGIVS